MQQFCSRTNNASTLNANNDSQAADQCQVRINNCNSSCPSNNGCQDLQPAVQILASRSSANSSNADWARQCQQQTAQQPQSMGGAPSGTSPNSKGFNSQSDRSQAATEAAERAAEEAAAKRAEAGFQDDTDSTKDGFNVANTPTGMNSQYLGNGEINPNIAKIKGSGQQGTIANNSGGQIPGQGGDGGGAKMGGGRGGSPGTPGYSTDVLNGFQGASAGATAGGATESKDDEAWKGYGNGRMPASEGSLDLRNYLPGHKFDPGVKLGGFKMMSAEINGPHVNVWSRITTRILEKCRLGELLDCR